MRLKTCKVCGTKFEPMNTLAKVCSWTCAAQHARTERAKQEARELRQRKEETKTRQQWLTEAQQAFNAYIRERDRDQPCISCGRFHDGKWDAGHYLTRGARPELRFNEDNVHKQCSPCNTQLSGNIPGFRAGLIRKIGIRAVLDLEGHHSPAKWTIDDLKAIKATYKAKLKALRSENDRRTT